MVETPDGGFDLDKTISTRLGGETDSDADTHLQALAVLIDADLSDTERAAAFAAVMAALFAQLSTDERERFRQIADDDGEVAAMSYLSTVIWPVNEADRQ